MFVGATIGRQIKNVRNHGRALLAPTKDTDLVKIGEKMNSKKLTIMKILFWVSFFPIIVVILISIYYAIVGHAYYDWFELEKISYTSYGLEEFLNSILYYGGYLIFRIPVLAICFLYQIYYWIIKKAADNE